MIFIETILNIKEKLLKNYNQILTLLLQLYIWPESGNVKKKKKKKTKNEFPKTLAYMSLETVLNKQMADKRPR